MNPRDHTGYRIVLASTLDYEQLTAEIHFDTKHVALISCEKGMDHLELELPDITLAQDRIERKVDLVGFLDAVDYASKWLRNELP